MKNKLSAAASRLDKKSVMPASGYQYRSRLMSVLALSVVCFPVLNAAEVNFAVSGSAAANSGDLISSGNITPSFERFLPDGLEVSAFIENAETYATIYDSTGTGGEDDDLEMETAWSAGNLINVEAGGVLIVQENTTPAEIAAGELTFSSGQSSGSGNAPDDQGGNARLVLGFTDPVQSVTLGIVDVEGNSNAAIILTGLNAAGAVETHTIQINDLDGFDLGPSIGVFAIEDRSHNTTGPISVGGGQNQFYNNTLVSITSVEVDFNQLSGGLSFVDCEPLAAPPLVSGAIGNYVYLDEDSDGLQDPGERGIPNAKVELLLDPDGSGPATADVVETTFTDSNGGYLFDNLASGNYFVRVCDATTPNNSLPDGFVQTNIFTNGEGDFGNKDNTANGGLGYGIVLGDNDVNLTADFGYNANPTEDVNNPVGSPTAALGDRVWIDSDRDGIQDPNEIGVEGVVVQLCAAGPDGLFDTADDATPITTTTDANGHYIFDGLTPDAYVVKIPDSNFAAGAPLEDLTQFGDPDHFGETDVTAGNNDNRSTAPVIIGPGDVLLNVDFGFDDDDAAPILGSIGDRVWLDEDNSADAADGDKSASPLETPISGVSVSLISDTNGDGVWTPSGADGVLGTADDEPIIGTDLTDSEGCYLFEGLPLEESYIVYVNDTNNVLGSLNQTYDANGPLDNMSAVTLTGANPDNVDQDFSYSPTPNTGSIGDTIWADLDSSGGNQDGQGPEPGLEGVSVTLCSDPGADGTFGTADDTEFATTTTDSNGEYLFSNLPLGDYAVKVDTTTLPNTVTDVASFDPDGASNDQVGTDVSLSTITADAPHDSNQDFSYPPSANSLGSLGDKIWLDNGNTNGTQDADEPGIAGVLVTMTPRDGVDAGAGPDQPVTTTTDENGCYLFTELPDGVYDFVITAPAGLTNEFSGGANGDGISVGAVTGGNHPRGEDFSLSSATPLFAIGSTIWFDADADGDRSEDPGLDGSAGVRENPITDVTVNLIDSAGNVIATDVTDSNGEYLFNNLPGGVDYTVQVDTTTLPDGISPVSTFENDSTPNGETTVTNLSADTLTEDFSFPALGGIGDLVYINTDSATQPGTAASQPGLPDVLVELIDEATGEVIASTFTDSTGAYFFPNLPAGEYKVNVDPNGDTLPLGLTNSTDPDGGNDSMSVTTLAPGEIDLDQDFAYEGSADGRIGTLVWEDHNADGTNVGPAGPDGVVGTDDDENPIAGVKVDLYWDRNSNGVRDFDDPLFGSLITSAANSNNENYVFDNLPVDDGVGSNQAYIVHVSDCEGVLHGYSHSIGGQDILDNDESKQDPYAVVLEIGRPAIGAVDFGYYKDLAKVGNYVWFDANEDGIQDTGAGLADVELTLTITYPDGTVIDTVTQTDADGNYNFCNLLADEDYNSADEGDGLEPTFAISVATPAGFVPTVANAGAGADQDLLDSDLSGVLAEPVQGLEDTAQLADAAAELSIASYDFGFIDLVIPAKDTVYEDFLVRNSETFGLDDNDVPGVPGPDGSAAAANDTAAFTDDADADGLNNLLEYALCFEPGTGLKVFSDELFTDTTFNEGFRLEFNDTTGTLDAKYTQPTGITDVDYVLETSVDGGVTWIAATFDPTTTVDNGNDTTTVCYEDITALVGEDKALARLVVTSTSSTATVTDLGITTPVGWQDHVVQPFCETFADPLLSQCLFVGSIDAVTGSVLDLASSTGSGDLTELLSGGSYYIEVTSGENEGARYDIELVEADSITLAADDDIFSGVTLTSDTSSGAAHNTSTVVPADLVGDTIVIREHMTFNNLFPIDDPATPEVEGFASGPSQVLSARIFSYDQVTDALETFWLFENAGDPIWVAVGSFDDIGDTIVAPGVGLFTHNLTGAAPFTILQEGQVRTNDAIVPLIEGNTLVASVFPVDQSADDRDMTNAEQGFTGSGDPANSDRVQIWGDDENTTGTIHLCYDVTFYVQPLNQWSDSEDINLTDRTADDIFKCDRSVIYTIETSGGLPEFTIPNPINVN